MKIRVLGGGWYGCAIAASLLEDGHDVVIHEKAGRLFNGASGGNPARLHQGQHYPRSKLTRALCQEHHEEFMDRYGDLTHGVPINLYAVAAYDSLVDFGTYRQVLRNEIEFITVKRPAEFGLENVEGAILTGERHIVIDRARTYFERLLGDIVQYRTVPDDMNDPAWDWTIDCTFCAMDSANIERYEPCVTVILKGPVDTAVTIMDGPFPSLYPWDESRGLCSLTSAKYTPLARCSSRAEAEDIIATADANGRARENAELMVEQMRRFYPAIESYEIQECKLSIRAQPRSGSDARLVDILRVGERVLRVRAGKIDAILHAGRMIKGMLCWR